MVQFSETTFRTVLPEDSEADGDEADEISSKQ